MHRRGKKEIEIHGSFIDKLTKVQGPRRLPLLTQVIVLLRPGLHLPRTALLAGKEDVGEHSYVPAWS